MRTGLVTLSAFDDDGFIGYQVDELGDGATCAPGEPLHPYGFASAPRDSSEISEEGDHEPSKTGGAAYFYDGSRLFVLPLRDPRDATKLPRFAKGSSLQYSATGAFLLLDGKDGDGSATLYVPSAFRGETATKAHLLQFDVPNHQLALRHEDGGGLTVTTSSTTLHSHSAAAYLELKDDGVTINGNSVVNGGMTIGSPTAAKPVAMAPSVMGYIEGLEQIILSLATDIDAKLVASPGVTLGKAKAMLAALAPTKAQIAATLVFGK